MRFSLPCCMACLSACALAQPQGRLLWSVDGNDGIYATVAIPDVDGDSAPEGIGAIYYGGTPSDPRKVYCVSGRTGETLWISRSAYGTWGNKGLDASPDLNSDGHGDVLLGTVGTYLPPGRSVVAVDGFTGDTLWTYSRGQGWGWVYSVRSFADVDGDSIPDALGAAGTNSNPPVNGAAVLVSGRTGSEIWFFRLPSDAGQCIAPFTDVDTDTVPDVLFGAGGNSINDTAYCLSGASGLPIWKYNTLGSVIDIERIADVNGSGFDDCLGGGWSDSVFCLEGRDGSSIWGTDIRQTVMEVVPVRDVSGDGRDDVVVGSWDSYVHVLSGGDGSTIWSGYVGDDVWAVDTLSDVTGDSVPEVVAGCLGGGSGSVRVFSGTNGSVIWQYGFGERVYDVTGVPDMNRDGAPDVLVGLQDQDGEPAHLLCFDGSRPTAAQAYSEQPDVTASHIHWNMADRALVLDAPARITYRIAVLDVAGRRAGPVFSGEIPTSGGTIELPLPNLRPAAYFARTLIGGTQAITCKFAAE